MKFTVTRSIKAQQKLSRRLTARGKTIAVVPTMGYLHEGHLSLIRRGLKKADVAVTTIFVNPAQFSPSEDFRQYPRDTKGDLKKIKEIGGQVVFIPRMSDMYPDDYETWVTVEKSTQALEGELRPTHFRGVTTIVARLFNIIRPDVALFGMKDYQQAIVLKKMTADLNWPIKIIICPTVREKDGLALSSRNSYLSPEQRREALALFKSLITAKQMIRDGQTSISAIRKKMRQVITKTAPSGKIDYIAFTEMESLKPVRTVTKNTVASLALRFGPVRLIDNMKVG
jgi:pantoate--beta-alanine ligase